MFFSIKAADECCLDSSLIGKQHGLLAYEKDSAFIKFRLVSQQRPCVKLVSIFLSRFTF